MFCAQRVVLVFTWGVLCTLALTCTCARSSPAGASTSHLDQQWQSWLDEPPSAAVAFTDQLNSRADKLVDQILQQYSGPKNGWPGDVDVVVSGGGNLDGFYLGVRQIISRLTARSPTYVNVLRHAGASAGGEMPFEIALKGENLTSHHHFAYAMLEEEYPKDFSSDLIAGAVQDHHWRMMAGWMTKRYASHLAARLNGKIVVALSCLDPLPKNVRVDNYTDPHQAASAFIGTGTFVEWYDHMLCSDGGATSGSNMTPLFQDHLRPQIIVNLMKSGGPTSMVFRYNTTQMLSLAQHGQDVAAAFFTCGATNASCSTASLSLCPADSKVSSNICEVRDA